MYATISVYVVHTYTVYHKEIQHTVLIISEALQIRGGNENKGKSIDGPKRLGFSVWGYAPLGVGVHSGCKFQIQRLMD